VLEHVAEEHNAVRSAVGLLDMSAFGKLRVDGEDALPVLQRLCANEIDVAPGRIVYTQWLNERGGIEADVTVTRLDETSFLVVTSAATTVRDLAWLRRHVPADARCTTLDVTSAEACLAVMGPRSRDLLQSVTTADLSNASFPFGTAREIDVGMAHVRAHRLSYVGELGWELFVPTEFARHVFDVISAAGAPFGLRLVGVHAMDSLRLEKGYRHFGHDIGDEDHVLEAGLGFAVKTGSRSGRFGPFIGREAVLRKRDAGVTRRLLQFRLEDAGPLLYHTEPIVCDGRVVGFLSSGAYGHHLGAAIGMGYIPCRPDEPIEQLLARRYEIEVAGERYPARASERPFYDPGGVRLRM